MYVDYKKPGDIRVHTLGWHTGEKLPDLRDCEITCVQADGDELEKVRREFCTNLGSIPWPYPAKKVVIWRSPWAQFIVDNLG